MPPKKEKKGAIGKGPAKPPAQSVSRPDGTESDLEDEGSSAEWPFVLDQLATLERARGLSPGRPLIGFSG